MQESQYLIGEKKTQEALDTLPYGLFVVGSVNDSKIRTIVANWVMQISFSPKLLGIAIEGDSTMCRCIDSSKTFSLNILPAGNLDLVKDLARPSETDQERINGRRFTRAPRGAPFLEDASACIECSVVQSLPTGDHVLFIGEVQTGLVRGKGDVLTMKETGWRYRR